MMSSQLAQYMADLDEIVDEGDDDFDASGLKRTSLVRVTRLAVVSSSIFLGATGEISKPRLARIKQKLAAWILT